MTSTPAATSGSDLLTRAREVYRRRIDAKVETENDNRYVVFDLDSEDFEIGDDLIEVVHLMRARRPGANITGFRVGNGGGAIDRFGSPRIVSEK